MVQRRLPGRGGGGEVALSLDLRTNYGTLLPMDENKDREQILNVKFYKSETGKEPVREWLKELPKADRNTHSRVSRLRSAVKTGRNLRCYQIKYSNQNCIPLKLAEPVLPHLWLSF